MRLSDCFDKLTDILQDRIDLFEEMEQKRIDTTYGEEWEILKAELRVERVMRYRERTDIIISLLRLVRAFDREITEEEFKKIFPLGV